MFKLKQFLAVMLAFALVATGMAAVSAEVDNVYSIFWGADGVKMVPWYNHDYSVLKGPGYYEEVSKLLAAGYIPRSGYAISEYSGGTGPQFAEVQGEYDEVKVYLKGAKSNDKVKDDGTTEYWVKSTPTQYQTQDGIWHDINDVSIFRDTLDNVDVTAVKFEDRVQEKRVNGVVTQTWDQPDMIWNFGDKYNSKAPTDPPAANPTPNPDGHKRTMSVEILNADGTVEWRWDDTVSNMGWLPVDYGVSMDRNDAILKGEQYTVYYTFLVQTGGQSGPPQLLPKNYGVNLVQKYGFASVEEARLWVEQNNLQEYVKYTDDGAYTYRDSIADILFGKEVYKINHDAYLEDLEEERNNK